jgi:hypothetical protein
MKRLATIAFFFTLLACAQGIEVLRTQFQCEDGHKLIYRFETPERMVAGTVARGQAIQIAIDWAAKFYGTSDFDAVDVRSQNEPVGFWQVSLTRRSDHQTVYAVVLTDGSTVEPVEDRTVPQQDLITLAHLKFTKFSSDDERTAFEKFIQKVHDGEKADFVPKPEPGADPQSLKINTDPAYADRWAKDRVIKAEWINWLCKNREASALVTSRGIEIVGARVDGVVNIAWAKVPFPLLVKGCAFSDELDLSQSSLRSVQLENSEIKRLDGPGLSVERDIDLTRIRAKGPVYLRNATIGGSLQCDGGHFEQGEFSARSKINPPALYLSLAKIGAGVYLNNIEASGVVELSYAEIDGNVNCLGAHLDGIAAHKYPPDNAFFAESMKVTGNVFFNSDKSRHQDFTANGTVVIRNASIGGNLDCEGGNFSNLPVKSIDAESVKVGADVYMRYGFRSKGTVDFRNSTIAGNLDCDGGYFDNLVDNIERDALGINSARIDGSVLLRKSFEARGILLFLAANIGNVLELGKPGEKANLAAAILDLRDVKAEGLLNERQSWPKECRLHGFTFNVLADGAAFNAKNQIKWLRRQRGHHFLAQPYEQTAAVLRNMGLQEEGVRVLIAKNEDLTQTIPLRVNRVGELIWYRLFGFIIGYGYRPWRAFWISIVVIVLGWLLFWRGYHWGLVTPAEEREIQDAKVCKRLELYPKFSAFVYSLETFVPLLKLEVSQYWLPNANRGKEVSGLRELMLKGAIQFLIGRRRKEYWVRKLIRTFNIRPSTTGAWLRTYLWWHIIAGWVLTTLWVAGLTGLVKT